MAATTQVRLLVWSDQSLMLRCSKGSDTILNRNGTQGWGGEPVGRRPGGLAEGRERDGGKGAKMGLVHVSSLSSGPHRFQVRMHT